MIHLVLLDDNSPTIPLILDAVFPDGYSTARVGADALGDLLAGDPLADGEGTVVVSSRVRGGTEISAERLRGLAALLRRHPID